jgi:putative DNA primase/helicase
LGAVALQDFLTWELPPRDWLVEGLIQERDAVMVHAYRGIGKSRFVHGLGLVLACGGNFLRYSCPEPRGVLLVDGELPREELQAMLRQQLGSTAREPAEPFKILAADLVLDPLPSLGTRAGQERVEAELDGVSLVILDNISTLCGGTGPENEAGSWEPLQGWLLELRRLGVAVVLVHHDGKGGLQRGTSKREDILSQVVQLKRPADYSPASGCQFEVHLTKARGVFGEDAEPFEAELGSDSDGQPTWTWRPLEDAKKRQVLQLHEEGLTQRDIARQLGIGVATVNRKIKQLRAEGSLPEGRE